MSKQAMPNLSVQGTPTQAEAQKIADAVLKRVKAKEAQVGVISIQKHKAEFARNELLFLEGDTLLGVTLQVSIDGKQAKTMTQDFSAQGLAALVDEAEAMAQQRISLKPLGLLLPKPAKFKNPPGLYVEATWDAARPEEQGKLIQAMAKQAEAAEVLAAGSLGHFFNASLVSSSNGYGGYSRKSYCEVDVSARSQSGMGSGWAWAGTENATAVDAMDANKRAIELAKRSENPVAVEPGRYTVILEPEALAQLLDTILDMPTSYMSISAAEEGKTVFSKTGGGNRIGEQLADPRVHMLSDPFDPLLPFSPLSPIGLMQRTYWLEKGILKNLAVSPGYAHTKKLAVLPNPGVARLEIEGTAQTLEQMIASTKRGIWIHRFSNLDVIDGASLLLGGVSRDGTFLIENGKVSKPVKNMRFSESPFFVLNKLAAFGTPQRSSAGIVCPRIMVYDFEFTSISDAI